MSYITGLGATFADRFGIPKMVAATTTKATEIVSPASAYRVKTTEIISPAMVYMAKTTPPFPGAVLIKLRGEEPKWVKPPFPNAIWVKDDLTTGGHWEGKKSASYSGATGKRDTDMTRAERRNLSARMKLYKECRSTGMPSELVTVCVQGLQAGASMEEITARLQEEGAPPEVAMEAAMVATAPRKSRLLLYGGIGAAGLVLLLLLRKKKQS